MYYYSQKSKKKILHTESCYHLGCCKKENIGSFSGLSEGFGKGYILCKHCSPLSVAMRQEKNEVYRYCLEHGGMCVKVRRRNISVKTRDSQWKIIATDFHDGFELFHKNTFSRKDDALSPIMGYHCQHVVRYSLTEILEYIVGHDSFRRANPISMEKKEKKVKTPPQKGTHRYNAEQRKKRAREKRHAIHNVLNLIDSLQKSA